MEFALELVEPPEDGMNVGVLEGRQDHASLEVYTSSGAGSLGDVVERAHRGNAVAADQDRLGRAASSEIDEPAAQKQVGHGPEQPFNIPL